MKFSKELKIGILATVAILGAIWGYKFLKGENILGGANNYYAYYENALQLTTSTPVYVRGLEVGIVTNIEFEPEREKPIKVTFQVEKDIKVPKNAIAYIVSTDILGGKAVELKIKEKCEDNCAPSGTELHGTAKNIVNSLVGEEDLKSSMEDLAAGMSLVLDSINASFEGSGNAEGLKKTVNELQATISSINQITKGLSDLINNRSSSLNRTLNHVASLTESLSNSKDDLNKTIQNFATISEDLKKAELDKTLRKTDDLISSAGSTMDNLDGRISELQTTLKSLNTSLAAVNNEKGSLGKLVHDDALYENLQHSLNNLDLLLEDLRLNPDRYLRIRIGKSKEEYNAPE